MSYRPCYGLSVDAEFAERRSGAKPPLEMPLKSLQGEAAQIGSTSAGPVLAGQVGDGGTKDPIRNRQRSGRNRPACWLLMVTADKPVRLRVEVGRLAGQSSAADVAVGEVRHPAHQAQNPETEVCHGKPDLAGARVIEDGQRQAKDRILRIVVGQRLLQHLRVKGERRGARIIHGIGERRGQDLARVEADQNPGAAFRRSWPERRSSAQGLRQSACATWPKTWRCPSVFPDRG